MPPSSATLPADVIPTLESKLEDFRDASQKTRRQILNDLSRETLPPGCNLKKHRKAVKQWFYNHGRKREHNDKFKYVRKWTLQHVISFVRKAEIQEICQAETNALPGDAVYLAGYQKALAEVVNNLNETEEEEFRAMADEWSKKSPPVEVQRRMAETHAGQYVKEFAQQMYRQLGMRVLIMSAHHDTQGILSLSSHDFNHELDGEPMDTVRPGWEDEPISTEWAKYAQSQMGGEEDKDEDDDRPLPGRNKKAKFSLESDETGNLILPDPDSNGGLKLVQLEKIIRAFLSHHYQEACGNPKASVPWGPIQGEEATYVDSQYIPEGFTFKEPSKLSKPEAYQRVKFWFDRQQDPQIGKIFQFRRFRANDGTATLTKTSQRTNKKPSGQKSGAGRVDKSTRPASEHGGDMEAASERDGRTARKRKGVKKGKRSLGTHERSDSSSSESSSSSEDKDEGDDEDENANSNVRDDNDQAGDNVGPKDGQGKKRPRPPTRATATPPMPLPFSAVPAKNRITAKPKSKGRHTPSTGPQFERRITRRRGREQKDTGEAPPPKKRKGDDYVESMGQSAEEPNAAGSNRGVKKGRGAKK